jgi:hypothetical protein
LITENATEKSEGMQRSIANLIPFKPGQSGNPKGKPKGSRHKLGEAFLEAMHEDFKEHGKGVIEQVRAEKPDQYLKVIASILPKELNVNTTALGEMSDDELTATLSALRDLATAFDAALARAGTGEEISPQPVIEVQAVQQTA